MKQLYTSAIITSFVLFFYSCKKLVQYHPNEVRLEEAEKNLNQKNIARLIDEPKKGSFRFAVIGDSQRFYDDLSDAVKKVNSFDDISFVLLNGDITDFGLNREYKWISRELHKFEIPFIAVIGNHDMLSNGRLLYQQMFGPENFSFEYNDYRFVGLNTNSKEVGYNGSIPDTAWLRKTLSIKNGEAANGSFVFGHIAPTNGDFDQKLSGAYSSLLSNNNVLYSVHGHQHSYFLGQPYGPPVNYLRVGSLNKRSFAIVNVNTDTTYVEQITF